MQMQLKVLSGNHAGKLIAVNHDKFIVGRSDGCHLRPKSDSISRQHCAILRKDDKILLVDLKSRNGTLVNDKKLEPTKAKILKDGDRIQIGKLEFIAVIEPTSIRTEKVIKQPQAASPSIDQKASGSASDCSGSDVRSDEFDVSSWIEEADQIIRQNAEPDTRQFQFTSKISDETIMDASPMTETRTETEKPATPAIPPKGKPSKLPPMPTKPGAANSKDAASETLKKFFSGGR